VYITRTAGSLVEFSDEEEYGVVRVYGSPPPNLPTTAIAMGGGEIRMGGHLVFSKGAGKGIKVDTATPAYGWHDKTSDIVVRGTGPTDPTWAVYRTNLRAYQFSVGDECWINVHVPHDYVPGTDIYLHVHWSHASASVITGGTTWGFDVSHAKGHNQGAFPATANFTVTQAASPTQYQHMIAEVNVSSGGTINGVAIEPDALILVRCYLSANNMSAATDPFGHFVDAHYQSTGIPTKQKAPDFYA
jgi:hypothetical protein